MAKGKKRKVELLEGNFSVSIGEAMGFTKNKESTAEGKDRTSGREPQKDGNRQNDAGPVASAQQFILHRESAGRGGRIVTAVSIKPPLAPAAAEALAKTMRKGLGCGSYVEESRIILQGDMRERAGQWLEKQGARKVVMGN